jgi:hypothetical protein
MANTVIYNLEIINNSIVTPFFYTNTITPLGKIERTIYDLSSSDGLVNVGITKIGTLKTIIAKSDDANIHLYGANSGTIGVNGILFWEVSDAFASGVIDCKVSTNSTIPVDVELTLIGVA